MTTTKNLNKSMIPTLEEMTKNLLAWYALASSNSAKLAVDLEWYQDAHNQAIALRNELENEHNIIVTLDQVIDVIACVSPGMDWNKNIHAAKLVILTWVKYSTLAERHNYYLTFRTGIAHGWRNYDNAWGVLDGTHLLLPTANKTYRFGDNIRHPQSSVYGTIDQHMVHIICNTGLRGSINPGQYYDVLENAVIHTAQILGLQTHKLQSAVWCCRVDMFKAGYDVATIEQLLGEL